MTTVITGCGASPEPRPTGGSVASARATQSPSLQEFLERKVVIRSTRTRSRPFRETSRVPPSARESHLALARPQDLVFVCESEGDE